MCCGRWKCWAAGPVRKYKENEGPELRNHTDQGLNSDLATCQLWVFREACHAPITSSS